MVKSCAVNSSGSAKAAALLMIGLVGFCKVNCAETAGEIDTAMIGMRRSPSPLHETTDWPLEEPSAAAAVEGPAVSAVPTLIANDDSSVSSISSEPEVEFYGSGMASDSSRRIYEAIMHRMAHLHNLTLTDIFTEDGQGGEAEDIAADLSRYESDDFDYDEEGEEANSGTENNSDAIPSSSYDDGSNIKTRGGSKESIRTPNPEKQGSAVVFKVADDDNTSVSEEFVIYSVEADKDDFIGSPLFPSSLSATSMVDLLQSSEDCEQVSISSPSPSQNNSRMRSASPYTRPSRASSIELDLATAACTAASSLANINSAHQGGTTKLIGSENLIREELMKLITQDSIYPLNLIDNYSSDQLYTVCNNVGTYILNHLSQQAAKMSTTPSTELAYNLLEQLGRVFTLVITKLSPDDRLQYDEIILKSLEVTISDDNAEYDSFRIVRDALILSMMDFPNVFSDDFLRGQLVYDTLQKIVRRSSSLKQFDTIDYIRLLSNLSNIYDLQQYFSVKFDLPERKMSEEMYLPLKQANLPSSFAVGEDEDGLFVVDTTRVKRSSKKALRKKSKKDLTTATAASNNKLVKRNNTDFARKIMDILRFIQQFGWLNRVVLMRALVIAFLLQVILFRK